MPPLSHLVRLGRAYKAYVGGDESAGYPPLPRRGEAPHRLAPPRPRRGVVSPQSAGRPFAKGYMEFDLFRKIVDEAKGFVYDVNLHHRGESTIHPRLPDMVRYAKDAGLYTRLHSNGTLLHDAGGQPR